MKKSHRNLIIIGGIIAGGYLLYKYFTPKKIADTITDTTIHYIAGLPKQLYEREKIFIIPYKDKVAGAEVTEQFVNISAMINRINPFIKPVAPIIDWVLGRTSDQLGKI